MTISPVQDISGHVAIFLLGGAGNSDHVLTNRNIMLSYVIRREERLAPKDRSLTADIECSWFELTISSLSQSILCFHVIYLYQV